MRLNDFGEVLGRHRRRHHTDTHSSGVVRASTGLPHIFPVALLLELAGTTPTLCFLGFAVGLQKEGSGVGCGLKDKHGSADGSGGVTVTELFVKV